MTTPDPLPRPGTSTRTTAPPVWGIAVAGGCSATVGASLRAAAVEAQAESAVGRREMRMGRAALIFTARSFLGGKYGLPFWHFAPGRSTSFPEPDSPESEDRKSTRLNSSYNSISYSI